MSGSLVYCGDEFNQLFCFALIGIVTAYTNKIDGVSNRFCYSGGQWWQHYQSWEQISMASFRHLFISILFIFWRARRRVYRYMPLHTCNCLDKRLKERVEK
jgi:hypothetical protein